jgi:hypothetical protein
LLPHPERSSSSRGAASDFSHGRKPVDIVLFEPPADDIHGLTPVAGDWPFYRDVRRCTDNRNRIMRLVGMANQGFSRWWRHETA